MISFLMKLLIFFRKNSIVLKIHNIYKWFLHHGLSYLSVKETEKSLKVSERWIVQ